MRKLLQIALLLAVVTPSSVAQIYLRFQQGFVTTAINNGGTVTVNATGLQTPVDFSVSITYAGPGQLNFNGSPQLTGSPDFTIKNSVPSGTLLRSGQSVAIPLQYLATSARLTSSQTTWNFTETVGENQAIRSAGAIVVGMNGTAPSVELGYSLSLNGNFNPLPSQDGSLPFPATPVNGISTAAFTVSNRGTGPAQIQSISISGNAFSLAALPLLPSPVNAGGALRFEVRYQPRTEGPQQGLLTVQYGDSQTVQVALRGEATNSFLRYEFQVGSSNSTTVTPNGVVLAPPTPVGQRTAISVRFTNVSRFDIAIPVIAVSGEGWFLTNAPFAPFTIAPDSTQFLTITFAPTQASQAAGRLLIGNDAFELRGEAQGSQLQYRYSNQAGEVRLEAGTPILFANRPIGESSAVTMIVTNNGTAPAAIMSIAVPATEANGFSLVGLPALPYSLGTGQSLEFKVQFKALTAGPATAVLLVNSVQFGLLGTADPLPELSDVVIQAPVNVQAFEQPRIALSLAKPYPVALRGTMTLAVESDGFAIDPTTQFSTGGRTVAFTIPAGSLRGTFATGLPEIRFQTGSVAGSFVLTTSFTTTSGITIPSDGVKPLRIGLAAGAPKLLGGGVQTRGTSSLSLELIGVTTTRSLSRMSVKVKARSGYQIANTEYTQDLTGSSLLWFYSPASAGYGGQFVATLALQLSASGNVAAGMNLVQAIESLTVTFQNERGNSDPVTIVIP